MTSLYNKHLFIATGAIMNGMKWLRVVLDAKLFAALTQAKARRGVTWDTLAEEALRAWLRGA
jgi:hypothetical protein